MIKRSIIFLTLWAISDAYISRMAVNRMRAPVAFRPGVVLQRPVPQRIMSATRRAPYILYRNPPHRFATKHINASPNRNIYNLWKTTRQPIPVATPEYEYVRAAPSPVIHPDAPNLSLSEKPIVVADAAESSGANESSERPKPTYEVTEKYADQPIYQANPKVEKPVGFSKASALSAAELQNIIRHNAALQLASESGLPAIQLSQPTVQLPQPTIIPHQFSMHGFHGMSNPHDFMNRAPEQIILQPNALYQPDQMFLHNFQSQILQQYPAVEFVPYTPDIQHQVQTQPTETQTPLYLLQNEQMTEHEPVQQTENNKNIVQRETQEKSVSSILPQAFTAKNVSENLIDIDVTTLPQNKTELEQTEIPATTVKSVDNNENKRTTPIYYAQIGQSVGNVIANAFYSAINDVRTSIDEQDSAKLQENVTTTTVETTTERETKAVFENTNLKESRREDFKNLLGSPFEKTAESVNVAYTILRANEKEPKVNEDGKVLAGQVVEAKISEDQEFNKEKANLVNRPSLRLYAVTEKRVSEPTPQRTVVKAKIPPKSKLIFDDKTGEPILRVYASYVDSPAQKEFITTKLSNMKYKEATRKQDTFDVKSDPAKNIEQSLTGDVNQVAQFGLKIKSRSDDYIPIFNDYEE
ncbi:unnamed protein product, partial [Brenthis ino]